MKKNKAVGINPIKFILDFKMSMHRSIHYLSDSTHKYWNVVSTWVKLSTIKFKA